MSASFKLLMISAMYENGGNTTHRLLDGHPGLCVYPFESQLGTSLVKDSLASVFPLKYRWPVFNLQDTPEQDYERIIDEECKIRAKTPQVSKFRDYAFEFSDAERRSLFVRRVRRTGRSRGANVAAFFQATFEAWKDYQLKGEPVAYVGYSPIIVVDAEKILADLSGAQVLHIVRNPWSAYADTKKRPVPLSLPDYLLGWTLCQYFALLYRSQFPKRVHIRRFEDIVANPMRELGSVCKILGVRPAPTLQTPSWNGNPLREVVPWGTIREPSLKANRATAEELTSAERMEIRLRAMPYLKLFHYDTFLKP